jgi:hypothetical protein
MALTTWDYVVTQEYVRIEVVRGDEVIDLITEMPLDRGFDVELVAEQICNAHNTMTKKDFEALAEALFNAPDHIIFRVAEVLRKSNPRFDMERFTKACKQGE